MRAVFDTNVVASASFWRGTPFDCLEQWARGKCEVAVSPELLTEYHETIGFLRAAYPKHHYVAWSEALTDAAVLVFPNEHARGATPDPDDEKVLECALAFSAECLVTCDKRHLLPLGRFREIEILNPASFLQRIRAGIP